MWYRLYDGPDEAVGPLVAGRLRGRAQQIAMNLRLPDPTGHVDVGDAALVRLSVDEVRDPTTGQVVQQMIPSGVQALLNELRSAFGEAEQLQATKALETFFEFRRGRLSLQEWSVQWQINLEETIAHAGLEINQVARTYLYLKSSGLSTKAVDDLLLQVHGDMRRFEEIRTLLLRMAHRSMDGHGINPTLHYEEHKMDRMDDDASSWSMVSDYWMEDPSWYDSYYYDEMDPLQVWYEDGWYDGVRHVVQSGTTLTRVPWVMLLESPKEVEKDTAKAEKEEKALASLARAKAKDLAREKDQAMAAMVIGKALAEKVFGWTTRTTWVLQQRGTARLA